MNEMLITLIQKIFGKNKYNFIILSVFLNAFFIICAINVKFDNSIWLSDKNIHKQSKDKLYKVYDKGEELIFAIDLKSDFFQTKWLDIINKVTKDLEEEEGVVDVKSPLSATYIVKKNNIMNILTYKKALDDKLISNLEEYKKIFIKSNYYGQLVSKDFTKIAIAVKIKAPIKENNHERRTKILKATDRIINKNFNKIISSDFGNDITKFLKENIHYTGEVTLSQVLVDYTQKDLIVLLPLSVILILFYLFIIYRKISEVLVIIYISLVAVSISFAVFFLLNFPLNAISISLPILILDITYGLSIYIFNRWHETSNTITDESDAIKITFKETWKPSLFTILAAAIGFGSFYHSELIPLSNYSACSVVVILLCFPMILINLWYFLTFANFYKLKRTQEEKHNWIKNLYIKSYYKFTVPFRYPLLIFSILLLLLTIYSFKFIKTETNFIDAFFKKDNLVRKDFDFVDKYLGGTGAVDIIISTKEENYFKKINSIDKLLKTENLLVTNEVVNYMRSYLTPLRMVHKEFANKSNDTQSTLENNKIQKSNTDNLNFLPATNNELAQEVLFMEFSRGDKSSDVLSPYVNFDYTDTRIHLQTPNLNSQKADKLKKYLDDNLKNDNFFTYYITGASMYFQALSEYVNETQVESILVSLTIAVIFFIFQFGFKLGLLGLLPNVIPVLMTLSLIVLLGIPFDFATVIIFSISFSMCVDDTLQFMHYYKIQKILEPNDVDKRIVSMLTVLGRPAFFTSTLFLIGISVFAFSNLVVLVKFGLFTLNSLLFDYLSNIFVLPAFLKIFDSKKNKI